MWRFTSRCELAHSKYLNNTVQLNKYNNNTVQLNKNNNKYLKNTVQLNKKGNPSLSPLLDSLQYILPSGKSAVSPFEGFQVFK